MRREFLKGYIVALMGEGQLTGSPTQMAAQAVAMFAGDLPVVLAELGSMLVEQNAGRIADKVVGAGVDKIKDFVAAVGKYGFKSAWKDIQAQYKRGMDANAQARTAVARRR